MTCVQPQGKGCRVPTGTTPDPFSTPSLLMCDPIEVRPKLLFQYLSTIRTEDISGNYGCDFTFIVKQWFTYFDSENSNLFCDKEGLVVKGIYPYYY